jgi:hypothetical protein
VRRGEPGSRDTPPRRADMPLHESRLPSDHPLSRPWYSPRQRGYGNGDHGAFVPFIGDWSENIKSGKVQKAWPLPALDQVPEPLRDITRSWGMNDG